MVVFLPLRTAKAIQFLLLGVTRSPCSTSRPPCRSSQSTMTASNFSESWISLAFFASPQISTAIDSFSRVGHRTPTTFSSWLKRSDSNVLHVILSGKRRGSLNRRYRVTRVRRPNEHEPVRLDGRSTILAHLVSGGKV